MAESEGALNDFVLASVASIVHAVSITLEYVRSFPTRIGAV